MFKKKWKNHENDDFLEQTHGKTDVLEQTKQMENP